MKGTNMIAIFQIILSLLLSLLYTIVYVDFQSILSIISIIGVYLAINIIYILMVIVLFIILVFTTEKVNKASIWKHNLLMTFSNYFFCSLLRVKPIVKGLENLPKDSNFVLYANHIEYNDPFYIKMFYKNSSLTYVSKEPLFKYPVLKNLLHGIGAIPIGKLADRKSLEAILQAIKTVKSGQPIGIFPEGKRSYSNTMGSFKPGAFKVAQKAEADISLVAIYNFHEINRRKIRIKKVKVYLTILPLIKYEDIKGLDTVAISDMAYQLINQELDKYKRTIKE